MNHAGTNVGFRGLKESDSSVWIRNIHLVCFGAIGVRMGVEEFSQDGAMERTSLGGMGKGTKGGGASNRYVVVGKRPYRSKEAFQGGFSRRWKVAERK